MSWILLIELRNRLNLSTKLEINFMIFLWCWRYELKILLVILDILVYHSYIFFYDIRSTFKRISLLKMVFFTKCFSFFDEMKISSDTLNIFVTETVWQRKSEWYFWRYVFLLSLHRLLKFWNALSNTVLNFPLMNKSF